MVNIHILNFLLKRQQQRLRSPFSACTCANRRHSESESTFFVVVGGATLAYNHHYILTTATLYASRAPCHTNNHLYRNVQNGDYINVLFDVCFWSRCQNSILYNIIKRLHFQLLLLLLPTEREVDIIVSHLYIFHSFSFFLSDIYFFYKIEKKSCDRRYFNII